MGGLVGGNWVEDECPSDCPDINGDGYVNVSDLLAIIDQWGLTNSPADLNFDGIVDVTDLLIVVGNWGAVRVTQHKHRGNLIVTV